MIGIISNGKTDIHKLLELNNIAYKDIPTDFTEIQDVKALLILGGNSEEPLKFTMSQYLKIETLMNKGLKVIAEFVSSFGFFLSSETKQVTNERLVLLEDLCSLEKGELVSVQNSMRTVSFNEVVKSDRVLCSFTKEHAHLKLQTIPETVDVEDYAIFHLRENVIISCVQFANYRTNRYAPIKKFDMIIEYLVEWLVSDEKIDKHLEMPYALNQDTDVEKMIQNTLSWFENNNILINDGIDGVYEGFGSEVYFDGTQRFSDTIRGDCVGEAAWLYFLSGIFFEDKKYDSIASNLFDMSIKDYTVKHGLAKGFVRWSNISLESNYGDDVARLLMPLVLKNIISKKDNDEIKAIKDICDFHIQTTGSDGIRRARFELKDITEELLLEVQSEKLACPSAHYNAYMHAVLLLSYILTNDPKHLEYGLKGLDTLMSLYPETLREQSQTQEESRLILALSVAYYVTKDSKYQEYLDKVFNDLKIRQHDSGAFVEWDEGYKAVMRHTKGDGECSLLAHNGDVVVDLLYTNNWLPFAFSFAYIATQDKKYLNEAETIVNFMKEIQIISENKNIHGAWMRAFDPDLMEYYGSPADKGWGPYCIESGWTVSQIGAGILFYEMIDKMNNKFKEKNNAV